ncbi:MAG: hypothetical protein KJ697_05195 [Nanoarchaeota archaeon]|nr:hypothetical protein [Nanoarchaeota archaeon]MBU4124393.1 hypothetical protein [Nanoarchaeota archaeon]
MRYPIDEDFRAMEKIGRKVASDLDLKVKYDEKVTLYKKFIKLLEGGSKTHTMKFHQENGQDVIKLPIDRKLPLLRKELQNGPNNRGNVRWVGEIVFDYIDVTQWGYVTKKDAISDGFKSKKTFISGTESLAKDRGFNLTPKSNISFYHIEDIIWG